MTINVEVENDCEAKGTLAPALSLSVLLRPGERARTVLRTMAIAKAMAPWLESDVALSFARHIVQALEDGSLAPRTTIEIRLDEVFGYVWLALSDAEVEAMITAIADTWQRITS